MTPKKTNPSVTDEKSVIDSLRKELEERDAALAVINSIQDGLASNLEIEKIFELVGERISKIFAGHAVALYMYDAQTDLAEAMFMLERGVRHYPPPIRPGPIGRYSLETKEPQMILSRAEFEAIGAVTIEGTEPTLSGIYAPLVVNEDVIGSLAIENPEEEHAFTEADFRLVTTIANSMSVALENARLFDRVQKINRDITVALERQTAFSDILRVMARTPAEIQPVLDAVAKNAARLCEADDVQIYQVDGDLLRQVAHFGQLPALQDGETLPLVPGFITGRAVIERNTIHIHDVAEIPTSEYPESEKLQKRLGHRSVIVTPLVREGCSIGAIVVRRNEVRPFSEKQISLLSTFADQAAIAIENVRLFNETTRLLKETEERNAELAIINAVQRALAAELDIAGIYEVVGEKLREIFGSQTVVIYSANLRDRIMTTEFGFEKGKKLEPMRVPFNSLYEHVLELDGTFVMNDDFPEFAAKHSDYKVPQGEMPRSIVAVPVSSMKNTDFLVTLTLQDMDGEKTFTDSDVRLLETLANSMSVALDSARLFEETQHLLKETQQRATELGTVNTVSQALVAESDLEALIRLIGEQMRKAFVADIVYVALLDRDTNEIQFPYTYGETFDPLPLGEGLTSKIIETGKPLLINADMDKRREEIGVTRVGIRARSYLGVPIQIGGQTFGVISVQSTAHEDHFDQDDLRLLNTIAANVGAAIRNAQLFDEIRRQKKYFEAVIQNSPAAIVLLDLEANVTGWNPAAEKLFGYTEVEALGRNIDDLVAKSDELHAEAVHYSKKALKEKQVHLLARRTRKDGSLVEVEVSGLPVIVDGKHVAFMAIYHDVTELQRARKAAEEANQAKSTFLANMSHELRTPLNAILGFTRIVRRKGEKILPDKQVENLNKVLVSADHLLNLINSVLDISKIEAGRMDVKPDTFELPPLISLVVDTSQPLVQKGVKLEADVQSDLPPIYSDQDKIKQILINLLSNAAKFTHTGTIILSAKRDDETLLVDVSDTGIGISQDALASIFDEFQQADSSTTREYGGTGLGLSISRSLARLLDGDLMATSIKGEGSTFTLSIPLRYGGSIHSDRDTAVGVEDVKAPSDQPIVLAIDDDPNVHDLLRENLGERGYQVIGVSSGDDGLRMARKLEPFAITLDIMMPGKDGWQVLHELKGDPATREIPVILVTIVDKQALGYQLGAADYLVKPLEEEAVLLALQRIRESDGGESLIRLLVVDDDPNIPEMVRQLVESAPYQIETAHDGQSALATIRDRPPDVILLDLMMPNMDGFTLIDSLQEEGLHIPIIVLTAKSLTTAEVETLEGSVEQIIQKNGLDQDRILTELGRTMENLSKQVTVE